MTDKKGAPPEYEGTRVDLGEDLLEQDPNAPLLVPQSQPETVPSLFESAKILCGEGMLEEAKKVIHQILTRDSKFAPASELLKQIHHRELQQIFSQERSRKVYRSNSDHELIDVSTFDTHSLLDKLDQDLNLGISASPSLFREAADFARFCRELDTQLADASLEDRIDLGIGFLETGIFSVSTWLFRTAAQSGAEPSDPRVISATMLLAFSHLMEDKPFEASLALQPIINDPEIALENKIESFYLMGRACEALGKVQEARDWYQKTAALDPFYRDVPERLKTRKPR